MTRAPRPPIADWRMAGADADGGAVAQASQQAFARLLAADRRVERRLAWMEALALLLAGTVVLLGRLLAERL